METPKNAMQLRTRYPTPRLSERKKNLFSISKSNLDTEADLLNGLTPLDDMEQDYQGISSSYLTPQSKHCLENIKKDRKEKQLTVRRSLQMDKKLTTLDANEKENVTKQSAEEQLPMLFSTSMQLNLHSSPKTLLNETVIDESFNEDIQCEQETSNENKRGHDSTGSNGSPQRKVVKVDLSPNTMSIPSKSFYSSNVSVNRRFKSSPAIAISGEKTKRTKRQVGPLNPNFNRGVHHKIKRRPYRETNQRDSAQEVDLILSNLRNQKLRNLIVTKRKEKEQVEKVHSTFRNSSDSITASRPLSMIYNDFDAVNNNNINSNNNNNNSNNNTQTEFSDIENTDDDSVDECFFDQAKSNVGCDETIPLISHRDDEFPSEGIHLGKRKFFKSGRAGHSQMEVNITDHIKASVSNGKISLVQKAKHKQKKIRKTTTLELSDEQAAVEAILKNFDNLSNEEALSTSDPSKINASIQNVDQLLQTELLSADYVEYRQRLPYNTTDPATIEQQHLLLDFLISNNICTEKNFNIFIADPGNHKEEAAAIVDKIYIVVNGIEPSYLRQQIPFNTNDPEVIAKQHSFLDFLIKHDICSEENFDIFIANYAQRHHEAEAIVANLKLQNNKTTNLEPIIHTKTSQMSINQNSPNKITDSMYKLVDDQLTPVPPKEQDNLKKTRTKLFPIFEAERSLQLVSEITHSPKRLWVGGEGNGQYQIDAGQKDFGAHQCKQCGLVYSVHEPEEEKIHRDYHSSLHLLRFKGWIDEDIVATVTEWSTDGRILRVTDNSGVKRRERIKDVLSVVDKEIGFSSYIMPETFVAFLAVIKSQIVGICLVQPLQKANKYLCTNGVDCCTGDEFEAKCGISRIWVSPLHRGRCIATKLIRAVRFNTINGEEISFDKIAFSAPTESGKKFAQKVTGMENFLVYQ